MRLKLQQYILSALRLINNKNVFQFATYRLEGEVKEEVAEREKWTHYRKNYVSSLMSERQRERVMLQPRGNPNLIH